MITETGHILPPAPEYGVWAAIQRFRALAADYRRRRLALRLRFSALAVR